MVKNEHNKPVPSSYNVDESGIPLDSKALKVIIVHTRNEEGTVPIPRYKGQITVVMSGNVTGQIMLLQLKFDAKNIQPAWTRNEVPGTMYGTGGKGRINADLFESWFLAIFPNEITAHPLLLLLDEHSTHYQQKEQEKMNQM